MGKKLRLTWVLDQVWLTKDRTSIGYQRGVDEFLQEAEQNAGVDNHIYYMCLRCHSKSLHPMNEVKGYFFFNGIVTSY